MRSASDSLITLCADRKYMGALPGIVSVLHTWGQQLNKYYESGSLIFKGSCACLENPDEWKSFLDKLYSKKWLPFLKETFNGNGNAIEYLARYAFRTAISNNRITEVTEKEVKAEI